MAEDTVRNAPICTGLPFHFAGVYIRVADPDPFDTDPDPALNFDMDTDTDPAFQFDMDSDPTV